MSLYAGIKKWFTVTNGRMWMIGIPSLAMTGNEADAKGWKQIDAQWAADHMNKANKTTDYIVEERDFLDGRVVIRDS